MGNCLGNGLPMLDELLTEEPVLRLNVDEGGSKNANYQKAPDERGHSKEQGPFRRRFRQSLFHHHASLSSFLEERLEAGHPARETLTFPDATEPFRITVRPGDRFGTLIVTVHRMLAVP